MHMSHRHPRARLAGASLLAVIICTPAVLAAEAASQGDEVQIEQSRLSSQPYPLVIYDVTGSTLVGPTHMHLAVYWNGQASIDRKDTLLTGDGDRVLEASATLQQLQTFNQALRSAGAGRLSPPLNTQTADLPLTTVTYFGNAKPNSKAHSFSYFDQSDRVAAVDQAIQTFIDQIFPGIRDN